MCRRWPAPTGGSALDMACGTGRYSRLLAERGATRVVALDNSAAMLRQIVGSVTVNASMMRLPFAGEVFDAVICGLALGHVTELCAWAGEVARVLTPGGVLLYSDFHPDAAHAGLTRSFRDALGRTVTVPHRRHEVAAQRLALAAAGLEVEAVDEVRVGHELRESFPGSEDFYARWPELALVIVVRARRPPR